MRLYKPDNATVLKVHCATCWMVAEQPALNILFQY